MTNTSGTTKQLGSIFKYNPSCSSVGFRTMWNFGGLNDGKNPVASLIMLSNGLLYGTTYWGGSPGNSNNVNGCGTIFSINNPNNGPSSENVIYRFNSNPNLPKDGFGPWGDLVNVNGVLYGMTLEGGINNRGTIYKIDLNGTYSIVYSFGNISNDGAHPRGTLAYDPSTTSLFGMTVEGGQYSSPNYPVGHGIIFQYNISSNIYTKLHDFGFPPADGIRPDGSVIFDPITGFLYGMTREGGTGGPLGSSICPTGCGTIFKIKPNTYNNNYTIIHNFLGGPNDGALPTYSSLILLNNNFLYGMTNSGGSNGMGTIFKIHK